VDRPDTDALLLALAAGDPQAMAALYDRFAGRMYRTALGMLGSREDAEDVVQDVFMALMRSRKRLQKVHDLPAYVFTALYRTVGQHGLRRARRPQSFPVAPEEAVAPVAEVAADEAERTRLREAIRALPAEQREVVTLKIDGELTFAQIAEVLAVNVNTAAGRYRYALRNLRTALAEDAEKRVRTVFRPNLAVPKDENG
jgi:RNA polymerase sigma-70 factor (ECF subfamily)